MKTWFTSSNPRQNQLNVLGALSICPAAHCIWYITTHNSVLSMGIALFSYIIVGGGWIMRARSVTSLRDTVADMLHASGHVDAATWFRQRYSTAGSSF